MPEPIVPEVPASPQTIKVGDKEYTPEQIEQLEQDAAKKAEVEENYKNLQSDYSKKAQRLSELEKSDLKDKANDVISGDIDASELTEQEKDDLKYMSKLGFIPQKTFDEVISKVKEDTKKEIEGEMTKKELREKTEKEISDLAAKYSFVKPDDLKKYMSDRAEGGTILNADEAFTLLYKDQIIAEGIKPADLPGVENSKKGKQEEPKAKILPLGSKEMSEHLTERLIKVD